MIRSYASQQQLAAGRSTPPAHPPRRSFSTAYYAGVGHQILIVLRRAKSAYQTARDHATPDPVKIAVARHTFARANALLKQLLLESTQDRLAVNAPLTVSVNEARHRVRVAACHTARAAYEAATAEAIAHGDLPDKLYPTPSLTLHFPDLSDPAVQHQEVVDLSREIRRLVACRQITIHTAEVLLAPLNTAAGRLNLICTLESSRMRRGQHRREAIVHLQRTADRLAQLGTACKLLHDLEQWVRAIVCLLQRR